jgi:hypothetical protein
MEYLWAETNARELRPGDTARVKADAYGGDLAPIHNGRILEVILVKDGDVITKSVDNRRPKLDGAHYSPFKLEKRLIID